MQIKVLSEGNPYILAIEGRLDTNTAPELEAFASELYGKSVKDIVVDLDNCDFISSAGLRVIVAMQKHAVGAKTNLVFRNVDSNVMDVFVMTGFDKILSFE